jgi:hypothetical protein
VTTVAVNGYTAVKTMVVAASNTVVKVRCAGHGKGDRRGGKKNCDNFTGNPMTFADARASFEKSGSCRLSRKHRFLRTTS